MTQRIKVFIWTVVSAAVLMFSPMGCTNLESTPVSQITVTNVIRYADLVKMKDEEIKAIKDREIVRMLRDTALANGIKPHVFCGLSYHESDKFIWANRKRMDSNNRYSYGLFQIQLATAMYYDKAANDSSLLSPAFNAHIAALIFKSNLSKYHGSYEMTIAAHNAGVIKDGVIRNGEFVKKVYTATGEFTTKFDLSVSSIAP